MSSAKSPYPTLHEVLQPVRPLGSSNTSKKNPISVVDGMAMKPVPQKEGLLVLNPSQLLSIRIPLQRVADDRILGYQRHLTAKKARDFARWLISNPNYVQLLPVIEISIDGNGNAFYTDGQHRGAGAVIADKSLRAVFTKRTEAEARQLFALQAMASKPSRNVLILDGDGPFDEYIQDAVTDDDHPWAKLITSSASGTSRSKMSCTAALGMLRIFVARTSHHGAGHILGADRFDKDAADDLAVLMSAFGSRVTNPEAFSSSSLRAIAETARQVFREREPHKNDRDRWIRHMTRFPFARYGHLTSYNQMVDKMKEYWNKGLSEERKLK